MERQNKKELILPFKGLKIKTIVMMLSPLFRLTGREIQVLSSFIALNPTEPCKTEDRKKVVNDLELPNIFTLNSIIHSLKKKGAIHKDPNTLKYDYHKAFQNLEVLDYVTYKFVDANEKQS